MTLNTKFFIDEPMLKRIMINASGEMIEKLSLRCLNC
jgi:hypothetical protein